MHRTLEDHIAEICPKCKSAHSKKWKDQFVRNAHYLSLVCVCGYEIFIRSKVMTSGIEH
ncbi:MAG: hypothetical protein ABIJ21_03110 [Nanoarchaeota archaeon]